MQMQTMLGWLAIFASAFCFYMATAVIRWAQSRVTLEPAFFVFARFALGFLVVSASMSIQRRSLRAVRFRHIIGRSLANMVAVYCFYQAVGTTTVANANILNMTYPIFVALIAWIFLREQRDVVAMAMVPLAFTGIWLIVSPTGIGWNLKNGWGLASGISASVAIVFLNLCRRHDAAETILFYMFGLGGLIVFGVFHDAIFWPNATQFRYLLLCSLFGIGGQYLLTYGFRFVTAVEGSIISTSRILLATLLGPVMTGEAPLSLPGWIGAALIFAADVTLAARKAARTNR